LRPVDRLLALVEQVDGSLDDVRRHVLIDVISEFDEPERFAEFTAHLPREVTWVHGQTMAADPWTRRELHETELLRGRRVTGLPNVVAELVREDGQLVHQGNVHMAERILQQLSQLGFPRTRDRDGGVDNGVEEALYVS